MASTNIKVIYNKTARRINVSENVQWPELAERLSTLFQLRPSTPIVLSYVDSDNDVITLNTAAELQDAFGLGITRFTLSISGSEVSADDWILPGAETPRTVVSVESAFESLNLSKPPTTESNSITESTPAPLYPEVIEEALAQPAPQYQTTIEDENLPEYRKEEGETPKFDKGKQKESDAESSRAAAERAQRANSSDDAFPFDQIQEQLQSLCEQFKDVIEQNPQLLETANNLMENLVQHIPADINVFANFLQGTNNENSETRVPFEEFFRPGFPFARGGFNPFFGGPRAYYTGGRCGPRVRQCQRMSPEEIQAKREECMRRGAACAERRSRHVQEEIQAKIKTLNSMGFYETYADETFEELISRYGGNIERVVEVLFQRQESNAKNSEKARGYDI